MWTSWQRWVVVTKSQRSCAEFKSEGLSDVDVLLRDEDRALGLSSNCLHTDTQTYSDTDKDTYTQAYSDTYTDDIFTVEIQAGGLKTILFLFSWLTGDYQRLVVISFCSTWHDLIILYGLHIMSLHFYVVFEKKIGCWRQSVSIKVIHPFSTIQLVEQVGMWCSGCEFPSMLWHHWLGNKDDIWPVKSCFSYRQKFSFVNLASPSVAAGKRTDEWKTSLFI